MAAHFAKQKFLIVFASQNTKSIAKKSKTDSRPHSFPRPLSAGGTRAEAKRKILFPRKIVFPFCLVRIEAPPHCPNTWRAEPQKEKCPFHFRKNPSPRKSKEQGRFFLF